MTPDALERLLSPIKRRIRLALRRGILRLLDDSSDRQLLQTSVFQDETTDDIERFQNYGHTSVPPLGSEAIVAALGGDMAQLIALIVEDKRCRPKNLKPGDNMLYHQEGHHLLLTKDGTAIFKVKKWIVQADESIAMSTRQFTLNASETLGLTTKTMSTTAPDGVIFSTREHIVSGISYAQDFNAGGISYLGHKHMEQGDGKPTGPPQP